MPLCIVVRQEGMRPQVAVSLRASFAVASVPLQRPLAPCCQSRSVTEGASGWRPVAAHSAPPESRCFQTSAWSRFGMGDATVFAQARGDSRHVVLLDGGTGEELLARGVPDDRQTWSAHAVVHSEFHETIRQVHRAFLAAGSAAITTNSYGITPGVGFSLNDVECLSRTAGELAREAVSRHVKDFPAATGQATGKPLVLGSLGPLVESYRPDKVLPQEEGVEVYRRMACALAPNCDCFLAETMSSLEEVCQAVAAVAQVATADGRRIPMLASFTLREDGCVRSGETSVEAIGGLLAAAARHDVPLAGVLFNCSEPDAITKALRGVHEVTALRQGMRSRNVLLGAYANRLEPVAADWQLATADTPQPMRKDLGPAEYVSVVRKWIEDFGVQIVGGCCGMGPNHIAALRDYLLVRSIDPIGRFPTGDRSHQEHLGSKAARPHLSGGGPRR